MTLTTRIVQAVGWLILVPVLLFVAVPVLAWTWLRGIR